MSMNIGKSGARSIAIVLALGISAVACAPEEDADTAESEHASTRMTPADTVYSSPLQTLSGKRVVFKRRIDVPTMQGEHELSKTKVEHLGIVTCRLRLTGSAPRPRWIDPDDRYAFDFVSTEYGLTYAGFKDVDASGKFLKSADFAIWCSATASPLSTTGQLKEALYDVLWFD
jgi:hypothetical protein